MKRRILNEKKLSRIVNECIRKAINEISTDTVDSASDAAELKYQQFKIKYGERDPRTRHALLQRKRFKNRWEDEFDDGNVTKQARMLTNRDKRKSGERRYVPGAGWRNLPPDTDQGPHDVLRKEPGQTKVSYDQDPHDGDFLFLNGKVFILRGYMGQDDCSYHCAYDGINLELFGYMEIPDEEYENNLYYATPHQRQILLDRLEKEGLWWDDEDNYVKSGDKPINPVGVS